MCEGIRVERNRVNLKVDFIYGYCRRGEEVIKETDRDIIREREIREENRNNGVRVLGLDN